MRPYRSLTLYTEDHRLVLKESPAPNYTLHFATKQAPGLKASAPQGKEVFTNATTLSLTFTEKMKNSDPTPYLVITPPLKGTWKWSDDSTAQFTAQENLQFATAYQITAKKGLSDQRNGFLNQDITASFTTIGAARVSSFYPANGSKGIAVSSTLSATFNQSVDHASAEAAFSVTPPLQGTFSWSGNTLSFHTTELKRDSSYKISVASGIKSMNGQDSTTAATSTFATEESLTLLNIPLDYQDYALSCEVASAKMALAFKGVKVSEDDLLAYVGYDLTPRQGSLWGDPDAAFVGNISGHQNTTGYGTHPAPIARAASHWRRSEAFSGWKITDLAEQIAAGNPVVIWGIYEAGSRYDPWHTITNREIAAWKGEHVRTLIGFRGSAENPTSFIINDPIVGRITMTASHFKSNWSTFQNSGVVIY